MRRRRSGEHREHGRTRGAVVQLRAGRRGVHRGAGSRTLLAGGRHLPLPRGGTARRPPKGGGAMAWVVKRWRTEGLERLLSDDAGAAGHAARAAAGRAARHVRRTADRAAADAAAQLDALERLGTELRALVRRRRVSDAGGAAWERAAPAVSG